MVSSLLPIFAALNLIRNWYRYTHSSRFYIVFNINDWISLLFSFLFFFWVTFFFLHVIRSKLYRHENYSRMLMENYNFVIHVLTKLDICIHKCFSPYCFWFVLSSFILVVFVLLVDWCYANTLFFFIWYFWDSYLKSYITLLIKGTLSDIKVSVGCIICFLIC